VGGYFEPVVAVLDRVAKGAKVGVIRDPMGQEMHVATAAHTGLVVFLRTFPCVHAGDPLCTVLEMG
jgi:predicted deacylase